MKINAKSKKLGIYHFYDQNGKVDRYVDYFLSDFSKFVNDLVIVCCGHLDANGKKIFNKYGRVIKRDNIGFDVWSYKTAFKDLGWNKISEYDEIIMLNNTIMGPVDSFAPTFEKMDQKDIDFWGLTIYPSFKIDTFKCIPYGYIPEHLQSHFIACRKSLTTSKYFQDYWDNMGPIKNYDEAIGKHEAIFTKYFSDKGFKWDVAVDTRDMVTYSSNPILMCPVKLIKEYGCPIFKRRSFFHSIDDFLINTAGEQTSELFKYLKNETNYDVDMIWETLLRDYPHDVLVKNMNLTYILPSKISPKKKFKSRIALIMHLTFDDLIIENKKWINMMPQEADIYITTNSLDKKQSILKEYKDVLCHKMEVRVIENRGRDVSSLLVSVKDVIMNYDIVCFAHDKKTSQIVPGTTGASFAYKCFNNILISKDFVNNVIDLFENNERLGILSPPLPNHGIFFRHLGNEWGPNYKNAKKLAKELGLNVPILKDHPPIAPYGSMFWFRPKAMKKLYAKNWQYSDFVPEPLPNDGTISHAIERIYPFVVQDAGYYPAILMSDELAALEYQNLSHYLREYQKKVIYLSNKAYHNDMIQSLGYYHFDNNSSIQDMGWICKCIYRIIRRTGVNILKFLLPKKVFDKLRILKNRLRNHE